MDAGGWESPRLELSGRDGAAVCGQSGGMISRRRPRAGSCPASPSETLLSPERPLDTLSLGVQSGHLCPGNPSDRTYIRSSALEGAVMQAPKDLWSPHRSPKLKPSCSRRG